MVEFLANNYIIFIIIAIVLLLGLFGYIMDRKKYDEYKEEIMSGGSIVQTNINSAPDLDVAPAQTQEEVTPPAPDINPPQN